MMNTSQAPNLEDIHRKMHGIAEQFKIMNEINAHLVQHLATANPPLATALISEDANRSCHSHRSRDQESQNCYNVDQGHSIRSRQHRSASLHSKRGRIHVMSESQSSSRTQDIEGNKTRTRGKSPHRNDREHSTVINPPLRRLRT